jgi:hypothetical protein
MAGLLIEARDEVAAEKNRPTLYNASVELLVSELISVL